MTYPGLKAYQTLADLRASVVHAGRLVESREATLHSIYSS